MQIISNFSATTRSDLSTPPSPSTTPANSSYLSRLPRLVRAPRRDARNGDARDWTLVLEYGVSTGRDRRIVVDDFWLTPGCRKAKAFDDELVGTRRRDRCSKECVVDGLEEALAAERTGQTTTCLYPHRSPINRV